MSRRSATFVAIAAGALALPASAQALPAGGVYTGTVGTPKAPQPTQPAFIRLGADGKAPADARIYYHHRCADGSVLTAAFYYDKTDTIRDGKLRRVQQLEEQKMPDGATITEKVTSRLTFTDTSVTGTIRMDAVKTPAGGQPIACDTGDMRVNLKRRNGYGGAITPFDMPAVLTRTSRTKVRMHVRATADCQPSGRLGRAIAVTGTLRDGRFSGDGDVKYTQADGTRVTVGYDLAGRLRGTAATGTLRIKVTSVRANGDTGPTCDSKSRRFALRRG